MHAVLTREEFLPRLDLSVDFNSNDNLPTRPPRVTAGVVDER